MTDRIDTVLEKVREVATTTVAEESAALDREARWPERGIRALQEAGLGGLVVPENLGGLGHGLSALARACEILGRECASTALCYGMHCVGSAVISAKATEGQRRHLLEPICAGNHLTTLALSEPGTGSHLYIPETSLARVSPEQFSITGTKSFVTNGGRADSYVISTAAAEPGAPPGLFSCVVLPQGSAGMSWGDPWHGLGMRGNASRNLTLRDTPLSRDGLLGEEGDEIWYVFEVIAPVFLAAMSGSYLGLADAAFDSAREHLSSRRYSHSGSSLSDSPLLQHRLGGLWIQRERARRLLYHACREWDARSPDALLPVLSAKVEVAECVVTLANEAMTIMGGAAYGENARAARILRDARAAHIMAPTTDMLKIWMARILLGKPLLGNDD